MRVLDAADPAEALAAAIDAYAPALDLRIRAILAARLLAAGADDDQRESRPRPTPLICAPRGHGNRRSG